MKPVRACAIMLTLAGGGAAGAAPAAAQGIPISPPALAPPAPLRVPPVESALLSNGLRLYVVQQHEVPVVQFLLSVAGGGRTDGPRPGLASFTAGMLDEGADTLDAFGIAAEAAYLGASLNSGAGWDAIQLSLKTPKRTMRQSLALLAIVALSPNFKSADVARQRELRLARILQQRDEPQAVAALAFSALVFPPGHPYHASLGGDSASTVGLDSLSVRRYYGRTFRPDRARLIVTGDVTLAEVRAAVAHRFGRWRAPQQPPLLPPHAIDALSQSTAVYLVDKPGAAQSVIVIGAPGVARTSPDYYALQVMNTILGGSFSSRINQNLRETRGYTYGAGSGFEYRPLPGPFIAQTSVRTYVSDSSLIELFKEFRGIRDSAVTPVELARAKSYIALGLGGEFETTGQVAGQLAELQQFGLLLTSFNTYVPRIMAVTAHDVQRVARTYLRPDRLSVVVVGDLARVRTGIEALKLGPLSERDLAGREVTR